MNITPISPDTPGMSEIQIQSKAYQYLYNYYPQIRGLLFHVPNGGKRNKIEAMQLKASGVIPGIPDLLLVWHTGKLYGIEVKKPNGIVSPDQTHIHNIWKMYSVDVIICYSSQEIVNFVLETIKNYKNEP